jgi:23S rRNA (guanosine2251-2'-O)-methyltransferase
MPEERASSPDRPPRKPFGPDFKRPRTRRPDGPEAPRFEDRPRREKLVHREIRTDFGESRPPRRDEEERPRYTPAARTVRPGEFELYGRKPVYEVLKLGLVRSLEVTQRAHGKIIDDILALAAEQDVPVSRADFFEDEEGFAVQGVRASAVPPEVRQDLRHFVKELPEQPAPLILMLDGITDPHNFGAILRTAAAAKVTAVVIRERRQAPINDVVVKASAGAAYFIPIFQVVNLGQVIRMLEEENYWTVVATSGENTSDYTSYHWETKTLLIVGGEGSGVSDLLDRTVKDRISISMSGMVESLNVSVATGIILFEALKRRETV